MNLRQKNLKTVFLFCLLFFFLSPIIFPAARMNYFVPFIIILYYKRPFISSLKISLVCGLILDLLSPFTRLGIHAVTYTLTTGVLYSQRRHFFSDSLSTLPLMTFFFSVMSTMIMAILIIIFERQLNFSVKWLITDLLLYSAVDAVFAFSVFVLPFFLFGKPIRKGEEYFLKEPLAM